MNTFYVIRNSKTGLYLYTSTSVKRWFNKPSIYYDMNEVEVVLAKIYNNIKRYQGIYDIFDYGELIEYTAKPLDKKDLYMPSLCIPEVKKLSYEFEKLPNVDLREMLYKSDSEHIKDRNLVNFPEVIISTIKMVAKHIIKKRCGVF